MGNPFQAGAFWVGQERSVPTEPGEDFANFAEMFASFARGFGSYLDPHFATAREVQQRHLDWLKRIEFQSTAMRRATEMSLDWWKKIENQSILARQTQETSLRWLERMDAHRSASAELTERLGAATSFQELAATWLDWSGQMTAALGKDATDAMEEMRALVSNGPVPSRRT
jgi:hypothetical protein